MTEQVYKKLLLGEKDGIKIFMDTEGYFFCPLCDDLMIKKSEHVWLCERCYVILDVPPLKTGETANITFFQLRKKFKGATAVNQPPIIVKPPKVEVKAPDIHIYMPEKPRTRKKIWLEKDPKTKKRIQYEEEEEIGEE